MRPSWIATTVAGILGILLAGPALAQSPPRGPTYAAVYQGNVDGAAAYCQVTFEWIEESSYGGGYLLMEATTQVGGSTYSFHADLFDQGGLAGYGDLYGPGVHGLHVQVQFAGGIEQFTVTLDPFGDETTLYFTRIQ